MSNERILLDEILHQQRLQRTPSLSPSAYFELFVTEKVLKDFDLSDEEIIPGLSVTATTAAVGELGTGTTSYSSTPVPVAGSLTFAPRPAASLTATRP